MNLLQMSFSGAAFITAVVIIRAVAINKLPKKTFLVLWELVILRLLIPFSIPSMFSVYTLVTHSISSTTLPEAGTDYNIPTMLVEEKPIGIVSVTKGLIEDLYILPDMQNMGHGTKLLLYAVGQCTDTPTLWILENNINAERLYRRIGFKETGRKNAITNKLDEIEFALT